MPPVKIGGWRSMTTMIPDESTMYHPTRWLAYMWWVQYNRNWGPEPTGPYRYGTVEPIDDAGW